MWLELVLLALFCGFGRPNHMCGGKWSAEKCKNRRKNACGGTMRQTKSDVGGRLVCWEREKWDDLLNTN